MLTLPTLSPEQEIINMARNSSPSRHHNSSSLSTTSQIYTFDLLWQSITVAKTIMHQTSMENPSSSSTTSFPTPLLLFSTPGIKRRTIFHSTGGKAVNPSSTTTSSSLPTPLLLFSTPADLLTYSIQSSTASLLYESGGLEARILALRSFSRCAPVPVLFSIADSMMSLKTTSRIRSRRDMWAVTGRLLLALGMHPAIIFIVFLFRATFAINASNLSLSLTVTLYTYLYACTVVACFSGDRLAFCSCLWLGLNSHICIFAGK